MELGIHDKLLAAIDTIYDCIGDDRQRAVNTYSQVANDSGVVFTDLNILLGTQSQMHWTNIEDEAVEAFNRRFKCPAREKLIKVIMSHPPCVPILRQSVVPDDEWVNSDMYKVGSEPWGFHSHGTSYISGKFLTKTFCFFLRRPGQESLDAETLCMLAILNKHIRRALNFQHRIDLLEETLIRSNNILNLIEFGLVLYDVNKIPVFINAAAQRMLDANDGLRLGTNEIEIGDRDSNERFQALLGSLYKNDLPNAQRAGGIVVAPRLSRLRPYSLMVAPMKSQKLSMENATAVVFLFDPHIRKTTTVDMLVSSYELTRAEAELAHYLALGHSLEEAAQQRGVSRNTIKTQLQSIFHKTETSRQSELVSLLLRSVAGLSLKV